MRAWIFAKRNFKELLRSPLSYVFCVGFPVFMLLLFTLIARCAGPTYWFELYRLTPGICVFSFMFTLLFMALLVSRDRSSLFLTRLYTTPMNMVDFTVGYALPGVVMCLCQALLCYLTAFILLMTSGSTVTATGITGTWGYGINELGQMLTTTATIPWSGIFLSFLAYLPVICLLVFAGILIGSLLNDRSAPGVSSVILSGGGIISGAWMPLETMGSFETVCRFLPFYPAVESGRMVFLGEKLTLRGFGVDLMTVCVYLAVVFVAALFAFRYRMRSDS